MGELRKSKKLLGWAGQPKQVCKLHSGGLGRPFLIGLHLWYFGNSVTYGHDFGVKHQRSNGAPLDFGILHDRTRPVSESASEAEHYMLAFPGDIYVKLPWLFS